MRRYALLFLIVALLLPWGAAAQRFAETTIIDVTDATSTQTTAVIVKPQGAKALLVYIDVTAPGSGLLLDINLRAHFPTTGDTVNWFNPVCPSADGITGTSSTVCLYGGRTTAEDMSSAIYDYAGYLPSLLSLTLVHGNATACTYTVDYQWVW